MRVMRELVARFYFFELVDICLVEVRGFRRADCIIFIEDEGADGGFLACVVEGGKPRADGQWKWEEGWDGSVREEG